MKRLLEEIEKLNVEFEISGDRGDRIVVFLNGHTVQYHICHNNYNNIYFLTVIEDGGVIVTDWEFENEKDFITSIINDIKEKAELYSTKNTKNVLEIYGEDTIEYIIDTGSVFGAVRLTIEVREKRQNKTRDYVEYNGIIVDAEFDDHIHDEKEEEELKSYYIGRKITADNWEWWEIYS